MCHRRSTFGDRGRTVTARNPFSCTRYRTYTSYAVRSDTHHIGACVRVVFAIALTARRLNRTRPTEQYLARTHAHAEARQYALNRSPPRSRDPIARARASFWATPSHRFRSARASAPAEALSIRRAVRLCVCVGSVPVCPPRPRNALRPVRSFLVTPDQKPRAINRSRRSCERTTPIHTHTSNAAEETRH